MRYEGSVFRPPSEAGSLIIQITIGCSHNKCIFCDMYKDKKFRLRKKEEIFEDLVESSKYYKNIDRVFLADGDALVMKTADLVEILTKVKELFPKCKRVGIYATPGDILRKSVEELKELKAAGLGIAYLGCESGSDQILAFIKKGVTAAEMIEAGKKMIEAGIKLSITLISGIGGRENWQLHAVESARVINEINPDYLGLLTLMVQPGTEIFDMIQKGEFLLLTPDEVVLETRELVKNLNVKNCVFRSNHASNYFSLEGTLPWDKDRLIAQMDKILGNKANFKSEYFRRL